MLLWPREIDTSRHQIGPEPAKMKFVSIALASASMLSAAVIPALAQSNDDQKSYQVSELRPSMIPIPVSRPTTSGASDAAHHPAIRRTKDGIRIVGPLFFPDH
ncbi:hypothetical protein [Jiella sp. M17.18]|uniref:hypothetical protein n=1 Tax=Jiella sp. M17.18 TaxID=3234247 RepID=UPI0034DF3150